MWPITRAAPLGTIKTDLNPFVSILLDLQASATARNVCRSPAFGGNNNNNNNISVDQYLGSAVQFGPLSRIFPG